MNFRNPSPTLEVIQRTAEIIQPTLIEVIERTVRLRRVQQGGNAIKSEPKRVFHSDTLKQVTPLGSVQSRLRILFDFRFHSLNGSSCQGQRSSRRISQS